MIRSGIPSLRTLVIEAVSSFDSRDFDEHLMQHIDEAQLESDPQYRYEYLAGFIGFGPDDVKLIQAGA
ncbi:MAG: hypothetical protein ACI92S_005318, partial [Planctomycetaceae bacterium]